MPPGRGSPGHRRLRVGLVGSWVLATARVRACDDTRAALVLVAPVRCEPGPGPARRRVSWCGRRHSLRLPTTGGTMPMLETDQAGRVLTVRMSNPPRNFMTGRMVAELDEMVGRADADPSIGAVVLTGAAEGAFITHYDVAEILAGSEAVGAQVSPAVAGGALRATGALGRIPGASDALRRTPAAGLVELRRIHDLFVLMNRSTVVFVAAINGLAMGGGC